MLKSGRVAGIVLLTSAYVGGASAASNPCATIRQLCEDAGFVQGGVQSGNGLQRDCIQPLVRGTPQPGAASRPLPRVDPQVLAACRAASADSGPASSTATTQPAIHDPSITPDDGLAGPVIGKGQRNPSAVHGGAYAPYQVEGWTRVRGSASAARELDLYYVLSTWNPYVVVLMASRLQVAAPAGPGH